MSHKALLLVMMEPPAGLEEEFNDWYDSEHFPQRSALPGFETGRRFVCLDGWPRWLALYDLASAEALQTPDYRAVSGANATPWSRRILPRMIGRHRLVARQVSPGNAIITAAPTTRLALAKYPGIGKADEPAVITALGARLEALPAAAQVRAFRPMADDGDDLWLVSAFNQPVGADDLRHAIGAVDGRGAEILNIYAPYRRS
ncbi:DUF4286 family protein [Phreatobacter stygius]|uniref:Uncharacterized protein n=1 Tax=Phreatobacter stygius TaxID=1940610 RepID=A0A4D7AZ71_9HYPH|nr:DUF4286 family protein [Phreatobacter stygius]QCI64083.1 hypothetical protein E8M01_07385 [Phreatobacter stygius]